MQKAKTAAIFSSHQKQAIRDIVREELNKQNTVGTEKTSSKTVVIYCDGGCRMTKNGMIGGWGVVFQHGTSRKELSGAEKNTTCGRMELFACLMALRSIVDDVPVKIISDSKYHVDGLNLRIAIWAKKCWVNAKGKAISDADLWQALWQEKQRLSQVTFSWCKGHSGISGNLRADELATIAMDSFEAKTGFVKNINEKIFTETIHTAFQRFSGQKLHDSLSGVFGLTDEEIQILSSVNPKI